MALKEIGVLYALATLIENTQTVGHHLGSRLG